jgi:hypothetical protein
MRSLLRRAVTAFIFWRHRRRVARACPDIAAIPPLARDSRGRWQSTRLARRKAIHDRLKMEIGR